MADALKNLFHGTLGITSASLYTVPTVTQTILKEIVLCNKTATAATATITIDGTNIIPAKSIPAYETYVVEFHSIVEASKIIAGLAGTASSIDIYISGIEVV